MTAPMTLVPLPALIADIGGTNGRFAVVGERGISPPVTIATAAHPTLAGAIREAILPVLPERPRSTLLAMAGVVRGDEVQLTNGPWKAEPRRLIAEGGFEEVVILNDFEALALGLPDLAAQDFDPVGKDLPDQAGTRLVLGPGTGLGIAGLIRADGRWVPVGGEGGHVDLGPRTPRDGAIWPHLARAGGRVEAEGVVSGPGLANLYRAIAAADGRQGAAATPADITAAGLAGTDPAAVEALSLFSTYLGRIAGDMALVFMARGGVYLGGGIAPRIGGVLKAGAFRAAFEDKAPYRELMAGIRTAIITNPASALAGLAALVRGPERFAIELRTRHWR